MVSSVEDRDSIDNQFYFYLDNEEGKSVWFTLGTRELVYLAHPLDFVSQMWSVTKPFVSMRILAR